MNYLNPKFNYRLQGSFSKDIFWYTYRSLESRNYKKYKLTWSYSPYFIEVFNLNVEKLNIT